MLQVSQLSGFGVSGSVARELTFIGSATSSGASITIPALAQQNDIAFLADFNVGGADNLVPSGFTALANDDDGGATRLRTSYRVLGAAPGGTSVTGMDGSPDSKVMLVFRPSITASSIATPTWGGEGLGGDPGNQTVTASGQAAPLVVIGVASSTGGSPAFNVATPAFSATVTQGNVIVGYTIYNESPQNQTVGMADLGSINVLQSGYLRAVFPS